MFSNGRDQSSNLNETQSLYVFMYVFNESHTQRHNIYRYERTPRSLQEIIFYKLGPEVCRKLVSTNLFFEHLCLLAKFVRLGMKKYMYTNKVQSLYVYMYRNRIGLNSTTVCNSCSDRPLNPSAITFARVRGLHHSTKDARACNQILKIIIY